MEGTRTIRICWFKKLENDSLNVIQLLYFYMEEGIFEKIDLPQNGTNQDELTFEICENHSSLAERYKRRTQVHA